MKVGFIGLGRMGNHMARHLAEKGHEVSVGARIEKLDSMSAHADASEILRWLSGFSRPPSMTYLVHGEANALEALRARIEREMKWPVHVAGYEERVTI